MENTDTKQLSFPQRNWLLLCILVAILSPLVVHWIQSGARHESYQQSVDTRPPATGGAGGTDTSYKVATPPTNPPGPGDTTNRVKPTGAAARASQAAGTADSSKH
jgi:hypothetical protein